MAEKTITVAASGATAATITVETFDKIGELPLELVKSLSVRLEVTTGITGSTPTLNIFLQRATQSSPGNDDWDDWYHFPEITTSAVDHIVHGPLPLPQDVDGTLGSASHPVVQEALTADVLLAGAIGHQIRIMEKITGTGLTAAVYNIHLVAVSI